MKNKEIKEKKTEEKAIKSKKNKKVKLVKAKKIPKLFKKRYSQKTLESKILRKIYIPADKELIISLFKEDEKKPGKLSVNKSGTIEKKQLIRLKKISRDIKRRKAGFKFMPFIAVLAFIATIGLTVITFKDIVAKKALVSAMQGIFGAKTEVSYLHIEIFNTRLKIKNLQQANSNDEMKNLFQVGEINVDFNLTELLRGKVDIEDAKISEVLIGTDRSDSGRLLKKEKNSKKENDEKSNKKENEKIQNAKNDLIAKTQNTLNAMFADYNPQNIIENMQEILKSPLVAQQAKEITESLIDEWKDEPKKLEENIKKISDYYNQISSFDYNKIDDPIKIKEMIELATNALNLGNSLVEETKEKVSKIHSDAKTVQAFSKDISLAIALDKSLIDKEISKFTSFKDRGLKNVFNDLITAFVYGIAEQYSPYATQVLDKVSELKENQNSSQKKEKSNKKKEQKEKQKKRVAARANGSYVYYKNDNVPKFLLENAYGSGENWMLSAKEFSSDADKRNKESLLSASLNMLGTENALNATIDARSISKNPFVDAVYKGQNIPFNVVFDSYGLDSLSEIQCNFDVDKELNIKGNGILDLSSVQILTPEFEPKIIYDIYKEAIESVKTIKIDMGYDYSKEEGLNLSLNTNAAENFQAIFTAAFNKAISIIAEEAKSRVTSLLSEKTNIATDKIEQFLDMENLITNSDDTLKNIQKELEKTQKELTEKYKQKAEAEIKKLSEQGLNNLQLDIPSNIELPTTTNSKDTDSLPSDASKAIENASEDLKNGMKNLFGR